MHMKISGKSGLVGFAVSAAAIAAADMYLRWSAEQSASALLLALWAAMMWQGAGTVQELEEQEQSLHQMQEEYAALGRKYPFSGGQIENVVRKSTVDYILSGVRPSIEDVCRFCDEEVFKSKVRKVGF